MLPQLLPQLLLFGAFFVVVVTAWFSPKRYRPRCRVAVLVGTACVAPRSSFFIWLVTTLFCVVTAALVLYGSGAITVRSEWWRRYSDHKRTGES